MEQIPKIERTDANINKEIKKAEEWLAEKLRSYMTLDEVGVYLGRFRKKVEDELKKSAEDKMRSPPSVAQSIFENYLRIYHPD